MKIMTAIMVGGILLLASNARADELGDWMKRTDEKNRTS